jgi:hypothetical protein
MGLSPADATFGELVGGQPHEQLAREGVVFWVQGTDLVQGVEDVLAGLYGPEKTLDGPMGLLRGRGSARADDHKIGSLRPRVRTVEPQHGGP